MVRFVFWFTTFLICNDLTIQERERLIFFFFWGGVGGGLSTAQPDFSKYVQNHEMRNQPNGMDFSMKMLTNEKPKLP